MWFLTFLSYIAITLIVCFLTISIAAGLYYLAELIEEYTIVAKTCIFWINTVVLILYILLGMFENIPLLMIIFGVFSKISHFVLLTNFPYFSFTSPAFLGTVILIVVNHYLALTYFMKQIYTFIEVITYFTLFLWIVPFLFFLSLSSNDNVLPTTTEKTDGDVITNYFSKRNKKYGLITLFHYAKESLLPIRSKKGF